MSCPSRKNWPRLHQRYRQLSVGRLKWDDHQEHPPDSIDVDNARRLLWGCCILCNRTGHFFHSCPVLQNPREEPESMTHGLCGLLKADCYTGYNYIGGDWRPVRANAHFCIVLVMACFQRESHYHFVLRQFLMHFKYI